MSKEAGSVEGEGEEAPEVMALAGIKTALTGTSRRIIEAFSPENRIKHGNPPLEAVLESLLGAQPTIMTAIAVLIGEVEKIQATQEIILRVLTETHSVGVQQGSRFVN